MRKKIFIGSIGLLLLVSLWYLFLKPNDYLVSFTVNTYPGVINQSLKLWGKQKFSGEIIEQKDLLNVHQRLSIGDSIVDYNWSITPITDSTSRVKVGITDINHSLKNRLLIPFTKTRIEKSSKKHLLDFTAFLNSHIKKFKVEIVGETELAGSFCAYLPATGVQSEKAFGMMRDFPYLSGFIEDENLVPAGTPFAEITYWDSKSDSIAFNFCYPIMKSDSLPKHREIRYKELPSIKAIKAVYNGNYITSDRAWYRLLDFANKRGIQVSRNPIEVFYDNPATNANELEWRAEIYMPILSHDQ